MSKSRASLFPGIVLLEQGLADLKMDRLFLLLGNEGIGSLLHPVMQEFVAATLRARSVQSDYPAPGPGKNRESTHFPRAGNRFSSISPLPAPLINSKDSRSKVFPIQAARLKSFAWFQRENRWSRSISKSTTLSVTARNSMAANSQVHRFFSGE